MSAIQIPRPCVAAMISWSRGWMRRSCTGTVGKPGHEALPRLPAVHRDVRADVGAEEEQVLVDEILPDHVHVVRSADGQVRRDRREGLAEIVRHEDVRLEVAVAMVVVRHEERHRIVRRRLDARDVRPGRNAGDVRRQLLPRAAVVPRDPEAAVVGAGVENPRANRRLVQRDDRAVRLGAGGVVGDAAGRARRHPDLHRVGGAEVGRDREEIVAALGGLEYAIPADVERRRVVRRDEIRRIPVEAQVERRRVASAAASEGRRCAFFCAAVCGAVVSPRSMRTESSYMS